MGTRILLGGGGSAEDERPILERFAAWAAPSGHVLYLPVARRRSGSSYASCLEWICSVLGPLGVSRIEMWGDLAEHCPAEIDEFQAVFIGGGNTYNLLHQLRTSGFDGALTGFARKGGILYGGSAGAIVLGQNIETCAHLDKNEVGLRDLLGLDLLHGDSVWCHYKPSDDILIRAHVGRTSSPVVALAETAGVWMHERGRYTPLGSGPVYRFTELGRETLT